MAWLNRTSWCTAHSWDFSPGSLTCLEKVGGGVGAIKSVKSKKELALFAWQRTFANSFYLGGIDDTIKGGFAITKAQKKLRG